MKSLKFFVVASCLGAVANPLLAQVALNALPTRILGQPALTSSAPNLVEGREFSSPQSLAVDTTASPPILYVADTLNNRVLAYRDAQSAAFAPKADLVIGQKDFLSVGVLGPVPGSTFTSGLHRPVGLAVDGFGNLFVVDSGNNRIVRYPRPFSQPDTVLADLVLGQTSLSGRNANQGLPNPSAKTINTNGNNSTPCSACQFAGLAFDPNGNLWFVDAGNNRVLRYPAASIAPSARENAPSADMLLGLPDYSSRATNDLIAPNTAAGRADKTKIRGGNSVAVDSDGNVWFADDLNRVLVYRKPANVNQPADRILGIAPAGTLPPETVTGPFGIGGVNSGDVKGIFLSGKVPFVVDTGNNRILRYDPLDTWAPETPQSISPRASAVIGQDSFTAGKPNRSEVYEPSSTSLAGPTHGFVAGGKTYVVDALNHRIMIFGDLSTGPPTSPIQGSTYVAERVLGQLEFALRAQNLIEGREMSYSFETLSNQSVPFGLATALDSTVSPPRLYVADTANNRILGYRDYQSAAQEGFAITADLVIGQGDLRRNLVNSPTNDPAKPTDSGLRLPSSVLVDKEGNLWVADRGNGRVLRFPRPFEQSGPPKADLVLGQASFTEKIQDPTARTMASPLGLAFTGNGDLLVSDPFHNRVLLFPKGDGFTNGQSASIVFGQASFTSTVAGPANFQFASPRHISIDSDDRLYVADYLNNRVQIFERAPTQPPTSANAATSIRLNNPTSVDVNFETGEIWVGSHRLDRVLRYPRFDQLVLNPDVSNGAVATPGALFSRVTPFGNIIVSDVLNRIAIYFPSMGVSNSATGFIRIAPAMLATIYLQTSLPGVVNTPQVVAGDHFPKGLGDILVYVNRVASPVYYVYPHQIAVQVPKDTPINTNVEFLVVRASTRQVISATELRTDIASPGFFSENSSGSGQVAAINEDGTINNGTISTGKGPATRGKIISFYLTGQGFIPGMPEDGRPPTEALPTPPEGLPRLFIGAFEAEIKYSGLGGGYPGLWQINAVVPQNTPPGNATVVLTYRGIPSNINPVNNQRLVTTIAVR